VTTPSASTRKLAVALAFIAAATSLAAAAVAYYSRGEIAVVPLGGGLLMLLLGLSGIRRLRAGR
jgi:hypothetical protein